MADSNEKALVCNSSGSDERLSTSRPRATTRMVLSRRPSRGANLLPAQSLAR